MIPFIRETSIRKFSVLICLQLLQLFSMESQNKKSKIMRPLEICLIKAGHCCQKSVKFNGVNLIYLNS